MTTYPMRYLWIISFWSAVTCQKAHGTLQENLCQGDCCANFVKVRGRCVGCPEGKVGINCSENCLANLYGKLCKQHCNCKDDFFCSSVYGCIPQREEQGCPLGKYGEDCQKNCPANKYGRNCTETCSCNELEYCHSEKGCRDFPVSSSDGLTTDVADRRRTITDSLGSYASNSTDSNISYAVRKENTILLLSLSIILLFGFCTGLLFVRKRLKNESIPTESNQDNEIALNIYLEENSFLGTSTEHLENSFDITNNAVYSIPMKAADRARRPTEETYSCNTSSTSSNENTRGSGNSNFYYTIFNDSEEECRKYYTKCYKPSQTLPIRNRESGFYTPLSFDDLPSCISEEGINIGFCTL